LDPSQVLPHSCRKPQANYIICSDAGAGQFGGDKRPYWWPARMQRSFETTFRKNLNGGYARLHAWRTSGRIRGFVFPYLGQQDDELPYTPPDLVRREEVIGYPTDFSPMSDQDIDLLSTRGEQLTRILIQHYCPNL
jgi:NTE family protein